MPMISVITPAYAPEPDFLVQAYESVAAQELPNGWTLEWVLEQDGPAGPRVEALLPPDSRVRPGGGRRAGEAATRNLALARARGGLIKNLDADDVLTPGVLARDIAALTGDPDLGWATSPALDLLPDGSTVVVGGGPPAGRLEPGVVLARWREDGYRLPVHPTTICLRRSLVIALGGWMALPSSSDTGLLIAASTVSPGFVHEQVGLLYRKWPGQVTASPEHVEPTEWRNRMSLISERANHLRAWRWRSGGSAGRGGGLLGADADADEVGEHGGGQG